MVFVGVGDDHATDATDFVFEVRDVGDDEIDAEHVLLGETHAAVDDEYIVAVFVKVHILGDPAIAAERNEADFAGSDLGDLAGGSFAEVGERRVDAAAFAELIAVIAIVAVATRSVVWSGWLTGRINGARYRIWRVLTRLWSVEILRVRLVFLWLVWTSWRRIALEGCGIGIA